MVNVNPFLFRVFNLGVLATAAGSLLFGATITINTTAPTVGFGPPTGLGIGGPSFTYTLAPGTALTVGPNPAFLDTTAENFGQYTFNSGELSATMLNLTLDVTPTVDGTTAATPLVFQGMLVTGAHTITTPTPYFIDFDPASNPSAQVVMEFVPNLNETLQFIGFPFDGYLFGVDTSEQLSTPASDNATTTPLAGMIAPLSQTPEPGEIPAIAAGSVLLIALRRRQGKTR